MEMYMSISTVPFLSFLYKNEKYSIEIIKDIDNNKYIKITKTDDNNDSDESLNLPLKNK